MRKGLLLVVMIVATIAWTTRPTIAQQKLNIAVAEFEARDVALTEAMAVSDFLRDDLVKMDLFNIVGRSEMKMILAQHKFEMSGCTDRECVIDMGRILHVDKIVSGNLARVGELYYIVASVIDVQTGKIVFSEREKFDALERLSDTVDKLAAMLANRLLGKKAPLRPGVILPEVREEELARGSVVVESIPPGADILLDGEPVGKTPTKINDITGISHQVVFMKDGFVDEQLTVNIIADQTIRVSAQLTQMLGMLLLNSVPQGAEVWLDGKYKGKTAPGGLKIKAVPLGKHKLILKKGKKFYPYEEEIQVKYKQQAEITAKLKEKPGTLFISSTPKGAKIYIDGRYEGITPQKIKDLPAGKHQLRLKLKGYKEYQTYKSAAGLETITLTADLEPLPKRVMESDTIPLEEKPKERKTTPKVDPRKILGWAYWIFWIVVLIISQL